MYCSHLSVTQLDDGGFFISWCQFVSGRHVVDIGGLYGQRFDASYQPVGSSFQINDLENYVANTSSTTLKMEILLLSGIIQIALGHKDIFLANFLMIMVIKLAQTLLLMFEIMIK